MRVKSIIYLLISFVLIAGCVEDEFPAGLYHYQVERLLSGGDTARWVLNMEISNGTSVSPINCTDSIRVLIMDTTTDSLDVARLVPMQNCQSFDTVRLGKANASGSLLFTDSLIFVSGDYWIIKSITSTSLTISTSDTKVEILQAEQTF